MVELLLSQKLRLGRELESVGMRLEDWLSFPRTIVGIAQIVDVAAAAAVDEDLEDVEIDSSD